MARNGLSHRDDSRAMSMISNDAHDLPRHARSSFVTVRRHGAMVRAAISGPRLGQRESQLIAREIHNAIEAAGQRMKHLVLDLTDVRTMSSLGLGMCIDVRNAARKKGADTLIIGLTQELGDLFRMMRVDRLYAIVEDEDELRVRIAK